LLGAVPAPDLAGRAVLLVVHGVDAPFHRRSRDRIQAPARGARLSIELGRGAPNACRELRRPAARLRLLVFAIRFPNFGLNRPFPSAGSELSATAPGISEGRTALPRCAYGPSARGRSRPRAFSSRPRRSV